MKIDYSEDHPILISTENIEKASWIEVLQKSWEYCMDSFTNPNADRLGTVTYNKLMETATLLSLIALILYLVS